jgi:hypothetical protein
LAALKALTRFGGTASSRFLTYWKETWVLESQQADWFLSKHWGLSARQRQKIARHREQLPGRSDRVFAIKKAKKAEAGLSSDRD